MAERAEMGQTGRAADAAGVSEIEVATEPRADQTGEAPIDGDGEQLPDEALAELAAVADAEAERAAEQVAETEPPAEAEPAAPAELAAELTAVRRELEAQREQTRQAVTRYREAALAAEPAIPEELVAGETVAELDSSLDAARRAQQEPPVAGFPVGTPQRGAPPTGGLSAEEKIAFGLGERVRSS